MNCDNFVMFDGAYALGSLSGTDRALYEEHLVSCDACMRRVAAARDSVQLLALGPVTSFEARVRSGAQPQAGTSTMAPLAMPAPPPRHEDPEDLVFPDDLLANLLSEIRRSRRRPVLTRALVGAAACLLVLGAVVGISHHRTPLVPLATAAPVVSVSNAVLTANLSITTRDTWQQVNLICTYTSPKFTGGNYRAIAMDRSGHRQVVGTWPAIPGQTATMSTPTTFRTITAQSKITSVIIVDSTGTTLAQLDV